MDDDGKLKLFADLYGHESRIALGIEGKAHLIARAKEDQAPARADAVGRLDRRRQRPRQEGLERQVFGNDGWK